MHWAIFSPSLLSYPFSTEYIRDEAHKDFVLSLLKELDSQPDQVDAHFEQFGSLPMGKYFEQLLFFMLERDDRFEVLLQNHQLLKGKQTIGEIDLILKDTITSTIEHWEIALKYYLQSKCSEDHAVMLGPNAIDNLAKKMKKLTEQQLPLSSHSAAKYLIGAERTEAKLFMKGQIFYHLSKAVILPTNSNPLHEKHGWCFISELEQMLSNDRHWCILEKPDWIGPMKIEDESRLVCADEMTAHLQRHFRQQTTSVLCAGFKTTDKSCTEVSRCFVVNDDWPTITVRN